MLTNVQPAVIFDALATFAGQADVFKADNQKVHFRFCLSFFEINK